MDEELLEMLEQFLEVHCSNDVSLFKIPKFGDYLRTNGFPKVADTSLRRNSVFRKVLAEQKARNEDDDYQAIITYKTLDIDSFMSTNRTPKSIRFALVEMNRYYKRIVEAALKFKDETEKLKEENKRLKMQIEAIMIDKEDIKKIRKINEKLQSIIKTSVYPEIANELLKAEGLLQFDHQFITDEFLSSQIITADSEIAFHKSPQKSSDNKVRSIKNLLDSKTNY